MLLVGLSPVVVPVVGEPVVEVPCGLDGFLFFFFFFFVGGVPVGIVGVVVVGVLVVLADDVVRPTYAVVAVEVCSNDAAVEPVEPVLEPEPVEPELEEVPFLAAFSVSFAAVRFALACASDRSAEVGSSVASSCPLWTC